MVKILQYGFALVLVFAFAVPVFAEDDFPKLQLAPGYGNIGLKKLVGPGRHSGFTMDTDYNLTDKLGVDLFTGYYSLGGGVNLYTNTFGGNAAYRRLKVIVPFATAGFGFASANTGQRAMATRIGGGFDIPFKDSLAIRVDATRMGFHFFNQWSSGVNYSAGIVLTISQ